MNSQRSGFKDSPISVNSWRQHKMLFPSLLPAGGPKYANMATFQAFTPRSAPCGKDEESQRCTVENNDLSPEPPFRFFSR